MSKPLSGQKVAILVANGFSEDDVIAIQRNLQDTGANYRIICPEHGIVSSWNGEGWGHHFAVDTPLGSALGADYDMLIIPGGQRSLDKLKLTAHSRRFISSFIASCKPVAVMGDALHMLIFTDQINQRTVSGPAILEDLVHQAGGIWSKTDPCIDGKILTGACDEDSRENFVRTMVEFFMAQVPETQAA